MARRGPGKNRGLRSCDPGIPARLPGSQRVFPQGCQAGGIAAPELIDDPGDPRIADYAHLRAPSSRVALERERGIFTVEGPLAVEALLRHGHRLRSLLVDRRRLDRLGPLLATVDAPIYAVGRAVIEEVTGFAFHRGVVAVAERPPPPCVEAVVERASRLLVIEGVNDHENLGGLYRNAAAFGVEGVVLDPTTADPLYRRVVRVSLGHVLGVPTARVEPGAWPAALTDLAAAGFTVLALTPGPDAEPIDAVAAAPPDRVAVLVGAEGPGLTPGALAAAGRRIRIPVAPGVDSLNVATAAAIALHRLA